jgi:hypothetical protein
MDVHSLENNIWGEYNLCLKSFIDEKVWAILNFEKIVIYSYEFGAKIQSVFDKFYNDECISKW